MKRGGDGIAPCTGRSRESQERAGLAWGEAGLVLDWDGFSTCPGRRRPRARLASAAPDRGDHMRIVTAFAAIILLAIAAPARATETWAVRSGG